MRVRLPRRRSDRPVIVCGSDGLALRLAEELVRMEEQVTAVVADSSAPYARRMAQLGARVLVGSAREAATLRAAGVAGARALALVDDDDVSNIHAALAAQDINASVRLVVRMSNLRLGRRIDELFDDCTVLSASSIAAPFFVDAALGEGTTTVQVGDRQLVAGPPDAVQDTLAVLASMRPEGKAMLPASAEGAVLVIGPPVTPRADPGRAALGSPGPAPARPRRRRSRGRTAVLLSTAKALISFRLRVLVSALSALVAFATVVFRTGLPHMSWLDAFYLTVTTFTGTGSADLAGLGASMGVRVFGAVLMLSGVLAVAVVTAVVVDDLIGARLAEALGGPVGHPAGHIVVCGFGTVGLNVAERLRNAGADVIAIERDPDPNAYAAARRIGVPLIRGDASEEETLAAAGISAACCLVAVTDDDVANLEAGLVSRALSADIRVVLRLFDSDLANRVGKRLDLTISRSVSMAAAPVFAAAMMGREVLAAIPSGRRVLLVADVPVGPKSIAAGSAVSVIDEAGSVRVLARVHNGVTEWRPAPGAPVIAGDRLIVVATRAGLAETMLLTGAGAEDPPAA